MSSRLMRLVVSVSACTFAAALAIHRAGPVPIANRARRRLQRRTGRARSGPLQGQVRIVPRAGARGRERAAARRRCLPRGLGRTGVRARRQDSAHDAAGRPGKADAPAVHRHRGLHAPGREVPRRPRRAQCRRGGAEAHFAGGRLHHASGVDGVCGRTADVPAGRQPEPGHARHPVSQFESDIHGADARPGRPGAEAPGQPVERQRFRRSNGARASTRAGRSSTTPPSPSPSRRRSCSSPDGDARTAGRCRSPIPTGSSSRWSWPKPAAPRTKRRKPGTRKS